MRISKRTLLALIATSAFSIVLSNGAMAASDQTTTSAQKEWCGPCKMVDGKSEVDPTVEDKMRQRKAKKHVILPDPKAKRSGLKIGDIKGESKD